MQREVSFEPVGLLRWNQRAVQPIKGQEKRAHSGKGAPGIEDHLNF